MPVTPKVGTTGTTELNSTLNSIIANLGSDTDLPAGTVKVTQ
jgi:hypothetical protein